MDLRTKLGFSWLTKSSQLKRSHNKVMVTGNVKMSTNNTSLKSEAHEVQCKKKKTARTVGKVELRYSICRYICVVSTVRQQ